MKDYLGYKDKVCVVTGAASGMGKETAIMLVDLGAKVYALDWAEVDVEGIEKYIHTDLSNKESIDEAFEQLPEHIDSYFGIAGVSGMKHDFETTITINFISNKYITHTYLKDRMSENGSIAYMSSIAGNGWEFKDNQEVYLPIVEAEGWNGTVEAMKGLDLNKLPGGVGYTVAKQCLHYLVAKLQKDFGSNHIRVNAVLPAATVSGLIDEFSQATGGADKLVLRTGYANRFAESIEMAYAIVFLNSNMASFISGVLLCADYGQKIEIDAGIRPHNSIPLKVIIQKVLGR